jgi:hypothetical protein
MTKYIFLVIAAVAIGCGSITPTPPSPTNSPTAIMPTATPSAAPTASPNVATPEAFPTP